MMLRYCSSYKQTEGICVPQNASVKGDCDKVNIELVFPYCRKGQRNLCKVGGLQGVSFSGIFFGLSLIILQELTVCAPAWSHHTEHGVWMDQSAPVLKQ